MLHRSGNIDTISCFTGGKWGGKGCHYSLDWTGLLNLKLAISSNDS